MSKNRILYILFSVNILLIGALLFFLTTNFVKSDKKIVFVNNSRLFDGFNMTKEMKRLGEKEFNFRKSSLDSLYSKLQTPEKSNEEKKLLMNQFIERKQELEKFNDYFSSEQSLKIWSRIHGYVEEFSKEKQYQLVIGADNTKAILFVDKNTDVTDELIVYINKKYEGIK